MKMNEKKKKVKKKENDAGRRSKSYLKHSSIHTRIKKKQEENNLHKKKLHTLSTTRSRRTL